MRLVQRGAWLGMLVCCVSLAASATERSGSLAAWMPADAIMAVEIGRPGPVLEMATEAKMIEKVKALPVVQKALAEPKMQDMQKGVAFFEARLCTTWPDAIRKLLGGGAVASVHPQQGFALVAESTDAKMLADLHATFVDIAKNEAAKAGKPSPIQSSEYQGVTIWQFSPKEAHAIIGKRLAMANRVELLKGMIDRSEKGGLSLAANPGYQAARKAAGDDAIGFAFANLKVLRMIPNVQKALAGSKQPLGVLLLAGVADGLNQADWISMAISLRQNTFTLRTVLEGAASGQEKESSAAFSVASVGQGALPNLEVPRFLAGASFFRDLHGFYAAKDKLFPERTGGLIFFENMMGIFFTGRDLTDEVLSQTRPEIRIVVAEQQYDSTAATPSVKLPAFAAVFHIKNPEKSGEMAEEAWQKSLGLVNITQGQKALPGLILDRDIHNGVKYSFAKFSTGGLKDKPELDLRFNFRPSLARVDDWLILSSSDGLAKDLIDAIKKGPAKPLAQTHSLVELDGTRLAAVLESNRETMIRKNMVDKGVSQQKAEGDFNVMMALMRTVERAKLAVAGQRGRQTAELEIQFQKP